MSLSGTTLTWTPSRLGDFPVRITALDPYGEGVVQSYTLRVVEPVVASLPPKFTSSPQGPIHVGDPWSYTPAAVDPDDPEATLVFSLPEPESDPEVSFDGQTLIWTPAEAGSKTFTLRVTNIGDGSFAEQTFTATAASARLGALPRITSVPDGPAVLGDTYRYQILAHDPDGDPLVYSLATGPTGADLSATGLLTFTPEDTGAVAFTLRVDDQIDGYVEQSFTLDVVLPPNNPPRFTSAPTGPALTGSTWLYHARAVDPDGDPIAYSLDNDSIARGAQIDPLTGRLQWTPDATGEADLPRP